MAGRRLRKNQRVTTNRSIAMLMGGPYKKLRINPYASVDGGCRTFCRIESDASRLVGFFVRHADSDFPARPTDHEHNVLQNDAVRFAYARKTPL
jgi:hypothetical protein